MVDKGSNSITVTQAQLHELRNRLTVVKGAAQLLDRHAHRDEERMRDIIARTEALLVEIDALESAVAELTMAATRG